MKQESSRQVKAYEEEYKRRGLYVTLHVSVAVASEKRKGRARALYVRAIVRLMSEAAESGRHNGMGISPMQ